MRTISNKLLDRDTAYENIGKMLDRVQAVRNKDYEDDFMFLDKFVPYDCNDMYDACFYYRNNIFLVRFAAMQTPTESFNSNDEFVEYVEKHIAAFAKPTSVEKFIQTAEEYGAIPCLMMLDLVTKQPVETIVGDKIIKDGKLSRRGQVYRWGLVNAETLEPVDPNIMKRGKDKPMTDWEKRIFAINFVCERLKEDKDCRIIFVDDGVNAEPNIWFRNASGDLCWAKVECNTDDGDEPESVKVSAKTKACYQGIGYTARITFTKEPFRSHHCNDGSWVYSGLIPLK